MLCVSEGPTAYFKLSNVVLAQDIAGGASTSTHTPELLLNNFKTSLGRRVARLLGSLFPIVRYLLLLLLLLLLMLLLLLLLAF